MAWRYECGDLESDADGRRRPPTMLMVMCDHAPRTQITGAFRRREFVNSTIRGMGVYETGPL